MTEVRSNIDFLRTLRRLPAIGVRRVRPLPATPEDSAAYPLLRLGIRKTAVVMLNLTDDPSVDELEFARIFSTELARLGASEVFPAPAVEAVICHSQLLMPNDIQLLGRLINVDAVVMGFIRKYDACVGPSLHVTVEFHDTRSTRDAFGDVQRDGEREPLARLERMYDAGLRSLKGDLDTFGANPLSTSASSGTQRHPKAMTKYLQFVSDRMVRELVEELR